MTRMKRFYLDDGLRAFLPNPLTRVHFDQPSSVEEHDSHEVQQTSQESDNVNTQVTRATGS